MKPLILLYSRASTQLDAASVSLLPFLARLVFAAVLLLYFWGSATTKVGPGFTGFLTPSDGAYIQIFPKTTEAFGYDFSQFGAFHYLVVVAGTLAEFVLPLLIVIGLFTRFAALGMMGFIAVQSVVDVYGHGVSGDSLGALFDRASGALIMDQRLMWGFVLVVLVMKGGGMLSIDRFLRHRIG